MSRAGSTNERKQRCVIFWKSYSSNEVNLVLIRTCADRNGVTVELDLTIAVMVVKPGLARMEVVTTGTEILSTNRILPVHSTPSTVAQEPIGSKALENRAGSQRTRTKQPFFSLMSSTKQMDSKLCENTVHQVSYDRKYKTFSKHSLECLIFQLKLVAFELVNVLMCHI